MRGFLCSSHLLALYPLNARAAAGADRLVREHHRWQRNLPLHLLQQPPPPPHPRHTQDVSQSQMNRPNSQTGCQLGPPQPLEALLVTIILPSLRSGPLQQRPDKAPVSGSEKEESLWGRRKTPASPHRGRQQSLFHLLMLGKSAK